MTAASSLRRLIERDNALVAPGVWDGLSARMVERAGFRLVYASGGAISRSAALPDLNLLSVDEVVGTVRSITAAVQIPVLADAATGYGGPLNVHRAVRMFEDAGVAGLHIEDQVFPKRCGHYEDKTVVSPAEMVQRLHAACDARRAADFVIVARTDALAVETFDSVVERAHRYMEAGADMIFVEAPTTEREIEAIAHALPYPKLINMFHGGKTPVVKLARLNALGYRVVIVPSDLQRAALFAINEALASIRRDGNTQAISDRMTSFSEREEIVRTADHLARAKRYAGDSS